MKLDGGRNAGKKNGNGPRAENPEASGHFSRELLAWYRANKRRLPWRENKDPYRIWVSEIMLQQTRVDTVIPYFRRFIERFPTLQSLAEAPEADVLKCWEGLGYYSRARNLQAGARQVVQLHGGVVPNDKAAVSGLKGVGPYTSGAILSIAFDRPEPAVDGNVMRVLSRYFLLEEDIAKPSTRSGIERLAASLIPDGAAGDFNQAIMELGALICTPKSPGCLLCPVMERCSGRAAGREAELPLKSKAKPPRPELRLAALIEGTGEREGQVLVRRRPDTGLLALMWELPHVRAQEEAEVAAGGTMSGAAGGMANSAAGGTARGAAHGGAGEEARMALLGRLLAAEERLIIRPRRMWMEAEHVFSHIRWDVKVYAADFGFMLPESAMPETAAAAETMGVYRVSPPGRLPASGRLPSPGEAGSTDKAVSPSGYGEAASDGQLPNGYRWIGPEHMKELAFPNVFLRILNAYWEEKG
ncbi:A/G-specific adenine glycosylase [uncultured Paenibacillus sp.]|uniref:A/G-specific adenine glycosylase n=1 Tax=uncultured Paenibacillus sp. TaxID=227322 RepID=UPI0037DC3448